EPSVRQPKDKLFPQIGPSAALRQGTRRAAAASEGLDLAFVVEDKPRRPFLGSKIEVDRKQPDLDRRQGMAPSGTRVASEVAGGGFGDLVHDRICRYAP